MVYGDTLKDVLTSDRGMKLAEMAGVATLLFVLIDAVIVHPFIWENQPTLYYFIAKPLWVGLGLLVGIAALWKYTDASDRTMLVVGGLVGVVYLQLYYTVVPIPMTSGASVQIGIVGNLTEGLMTHYGAFAIAIAVVLVAYRVGGDDS